MAPSGKVKAQPGGRRKGTSTMNYVLKVRITDEMADRLYRDALRNGQSLAAYVRDLWSRTHKSLSQRDVEA